MAGRDASSGRPPFREILTATAIGSGPSRLAPCGNSHAPDTGWTRNKILPDWLP